MEKKFHIVKKTEGGNGSCMKKERREGLVVENPTKKRK